MIRSYKDLEVYKRGYRLALEMHKITLTFPDYEKYELASQIRRASKSISLNIVEGYGRKKSAEDFKRFLTMALGSCDELRVALDFCKDLGYITDTQYKYFTDEYDVLGRMLNKLIQSWKRF